MEYCVYYNIYIYIIFYYSTLKKGNPAIWATWMDLDKIIQSKISKAQEDKLYDFTYMWNLK